MSNWDGIERRKNMSTEIQDLKVEIAGFTSKVGSWMETTTEYRKSLCDKINIINEKIADLPCKERKAWYQSTGRQVGFMWLVLAILLVAVLGSFAAGHTDRQAMAKDLSDIQSVAKTNAISIEALVREKR